MNLTPDHLDRYASVEAYGAAKLKLGAQPRRRRRRWSSTPTTPFFCAPPASGCASARACAPSRPGARATTAAAPSTASSTATSWSRSASAIPSASCTSSAGTTSATRWRRSCSCAATSSPRYEQVRAALRAFRPLPHRMQLVGERRGLRFYDDSKATNVDSVVAGLDGFPAPFVLIAGGRDKGGSYAPLVQALRDNRCRAVVLIGEAADQIAARAIGDGVPPIVRATLDGDAVARAVERAQAGRRGRAVAGVQLLRHVRQLRASRPRLRGGRGGAVTREAHRPTTTSTTNLKRADRRADAATPGRRREHDIVLFAAVLALVGFGIVMVYSASAVYATQKFGSRPTSSSAICCGAALGLTRDGRRHAHRLRRLPPLVVRAADRRRSACSPRCSSSARASTARVAGSTSAASASSRRSWPSSRSSSTSRTRSPRRRRRCARSPSASCRT